MAATKFCEWCGEHVNRPCDTGDEAERCIYPSEDEVIKVDPRAWKDLYLAKDKVHFINDPVNPKHYSKYAIEPIEFILGNNLPYAVGNVIKYVMRYKDKNGLEDLKKAKQYIDLLIKHEYGGGQ